MEKRIAVVGAGAVGGFIGAYLARSGRDVTLIDFWPEHVEAIRRDGLRIIGMTEEEDFSVRVSTMHATEVQNLSKQKPVDIAFICVKSYDTAWATMLIRSYLAPDGYVVSAQNCINEEAIAGIVGWGRTVGCVVGNNFAVDLFEAGHVRRTMPRDLSIHSLQVGEVHGRVTRRVEELVDILKAVDGCVPTTNLWGVRWSKLCVNGMRNSVSAVTGMSGNERDGHDVVRRVGIRLGGEAVRVGQALGYELESMVRIAPEKFAAAVTGDEAALAEVERILVEGTKGSARSNYQRPSMAQDIQKGRRTEIDFINGFIAERARDAGIPAPTHEVMVRLVKQVERGELVPRPENLFDV
jgi:2-dehydropantoate 2-reductase